jgi:hypothetical protein
MLGGNLVRRFCIEDFKMAKDIKCYSDVELQAEVERREKARNVKPQPLDTINWSSVQKYVEAAADHVAEGKGAPKDFEHYLFERVMESMYGVYIWTWWNKNYEGHDD